MCSSTFLHDLYLTCIIPINLTRKCHFTVYMYVMLMCLAIVVVVFYEAPHVYMYMYKY